MDGREKEKWGLKTSEMNKLLLLPIQLQRSTRHVKGDFGDEEKRTTCMLYILSAKSASEMTYCILCRDGGGDVKLYSLTHETFETTALLTAPP